MSATAGQESKMGKQSLGVERRAGVGRRVHFEALVAVGGTAGTSGFEAESVDVSREGMRLRTAYLPDIGDRLLCRFDGEEREILVEGEVTWRREEARGGEFGLCFLSHDKQVAAALKELCIEPEPDPVAPKNKCSARGARVKLHIEGLGSPMKARVRDAESDQVEVGSNLEFLRVGRTVELEDVDIASKREAYVDHVSVDIDPETSIPQLVVTLRFDGVLGTAVARSATPAPVRAQAAQPTAKVSTPVPSPSVAAPRVQASAAAYDSNATDSNENVGDQPEPSEAPAPSVAPKTVQSAPPASCRQDADEATAQSAPSRPARSVRQTTSEASGGSNPSSADPEEKVQATADDEDVEVEEFFKNSPLRTASKKASAFTDAAAKRIGPAMSGMSMRAKWAMGAMLDTVQRKREQRADAKRAARPRRTTAPPPSGALLSDGKRLVRAREEEEVEEAPPPRNARRAAVMGSAAGLFVVIGAVGLMRLVSDDETEPDPALSMTDAAEVAPEVAIPPAAVEGGQTANVPLFGATPLSTTEQVLPPAPGEMKLTQDPAEAAESGEEAEAAAPATIENEWGKGEVSKPVVLRIKVDGPIEGIVGADGGTGFTVTIPKRKVLSSVSQLARKDKRIVSVKAVNRENGAEVTVRFRDDVPPFHVKAKGDRLDIAVGTETKTVASKSSKKKK